MNSLIIKNEQGTQPKYSININTKSDIRKCLNYFWFFSPSDRLQFSNILRKRMEDLNVSFYIEEGDRLLTFFPYSKHILKPESDYVTDISSTVKSIQILGDVSKKIIIEKGFGLISFSLNGINIKNIDFALFKLEELLIMNINRMTQDDCEFIWNIVDRLYYNYINLMGTDDDYIYYKTIDEFICKLKDPNTDRDELEKTYEVIKSIISNDKSNIYYIFRHIEAVKNFYKDIPLNISFIEDIHNIRTKALGGKMDVRILSNVMNPELISVKTMEEIKELRMEYDFALRSSMIEKSLLKSEIPVSNPLLRGENYEIHLIMEYLNGKLKSSRVRNVLDCFNTNLSQSDLFLLSKTDYTIMTSRDSNDNVVYFVTDKVYTKLSLVVSNNNGELALICFYDGMNKNIEPFFVVNDLSDLLVVPSILVTRIHFESFYVPDEEMLRACTEGLNIDGDGNLLFKFRPKKAFMDSYMEIHTILMENKKQKNYDGMKDNLVHMFILIQSIEKEMYKKKTKYNKEDLIKARAFAINDFKSNLKIIQQKEPRFDFYNYLISSNYSNVVININPDTIQGIKKLIKSIIS